MKISTFLLVILLTTAVGAQELKFGDENAAQETKAKTRTIYGQEGKTSFFLTDKSFGLGSRCGTELTVYSFEGEINRIVSKTCTKLGRRGVEYYFESGKPIFIFDVEEFFDGAAAPKQWRNFKGIAGRESRLYFSDGVLVFHRHNGRLVSAQEQFVKLKKEALELLEYSAENSKKRSQ